MRKTIALVVAGLLALVLGPVIIYDIVTDYRYAAGQYLDSKKPAQAKIHEAERKLNKGTEAVAKLKVAANRMKYEKARLERLLAQAPLPLSVMQRQHLELRALVAKARQTGARIEYNGRLRTPTQMAAVLARQRAELQKYERYATTIAKLGRMKVKTEAAISQALDERGAVKAELEYAKAVTRVAEATSITRDPFQATVGEFKEAEDALAEVIALQEVRLDAGERESAFAGKGRLVPVE